MADVTVQELDTLLKAVLDKEDEIEKIKEVLTGHNKELGALQGKCAAYLKDLSRRDYDSPYGRVKIKERWSITLPENEERKKELFEHLRTRGIFDKYATVNSRSLNSLYMKDWEVAKDRGEGLTFNMPGINAPTLFETIDFKRKK